MPHSIEVMFTPAEFELLPQRDLSQTMCIVFDVLRATSSMLTAIANGAQTIIPVAEITEALAMRQKVPGALLAGERNGFRITAQQTGGIEFDLGNSPREYTPERVRGKTIITTTTNGTRALRACAGAQTVLIGAFLNLQALVDWIQFTHPQDLLLVCGGTHDQAAYEDVLAAGALFDRLGATWKTGLTADSALMALKLYQMAQPNLSLALQTARNGQRLMGIPELMDDVAFCCRPDAVPLVAGLSPDGTIQRWEWA